MKSLRRLLLTLTFLVLPFFAHANAFDGAGIFSLDARYLGIALKNNGWGLGLAYEFPIKTFASFKGLFSHMTLMPSEEQDWITTVGIGMEGRLYPFNHGMRFLYLGMGMGTDFIMFTGAEDLNYTYINCCPFAGWKQNFFDFVMLEGRFGYRIMLSQPNEFILDHGIVSHGLEYSLTVQLNIKKILKLIFSKKSESESFTKEVIL